MSTFPHDWHGEDPYDGPLYTCRKCKRQVQYLIPEANDCPVSDAEQNAAAWLGQAGLYRTRLEAVQNGEQHLEPVSADKLFELARCHVLEGRIHA